MSLLGLFRPRRCVAFLPIKILSRNLQLISRADFKLMKPPIFDFLSRGYPQWLTFDETSNRFNENTKVICVEGNIASGKHQIASKIAEYFGMMHKMDPTDDDIYILRHYNPPIDIRHHNTLLPKGAKYFTTEMFWTEDNLRENGKPMYLQYQYYLNRFWNYLVGIYTLFSTGQGLVTDRSPFSDMVFVEALLKCGYISEYARDWFMHMHTMSTMEIWKPHLVVYVKTTNTQIRDAIKKRGLPWEINAKNLTDTFLNVYRDELERYLEMLSEYSQIFVIDRSSTDIYDENEIIMIMEKLTQFDYEGEKLIRDDKKYLEWRNAFFNERSMTHFRERFSSSNRKFSQLFDNFNIPLDLMEARYSFDMKELQHEVYKMDPRLKYISGHDPKKDNIWRILFDPFLERKNFAINWPTHFLT